MTLPVKVDAALQRLEEAGSVFMADARAAVVDALAQAHAAAEAERNEWKDITSVFLAATEPNQPIPVQGQIMLAQVRERARATFDAHPTPAAPDRGEMERVARVAAEFALREFCRMEDINVDRIEPSDINRAVAAATRGV